MSDKLFIRLHYPLELSLWSEAKDKIEGEIPYKFKFTKITCEVVLKNREDYLAGVHEIKDTKSPFKYYAYKRGFDFSLILPSKLFDYNKLIGKDYKCLIALYKVIVAAINRVLRSYRYAPFAEYIKTIDLDLDNVEAYYDDWKIEISPDNSTWKRIVEAKTLEELFISRGKRTFDPMLFSPSLRGISDYIEYNIKPKPEQEFVVNAREHLGRKNYRLSIIESIIALEMVLYEYLLKRLRKNNIFTETDLPKFLNSNLHLAHRIRLLKILLPEYEKSKLSFDDVLEINHLRNLIIHEGGKIPSNMSDDDKYEKIIAVLRLAYVLREHIYQFDADPIFVSIIEELRKSYGMNSIMLFMRRAYRITAEVKYFFDDLPAKDKLTEIGATIKTLLSKKNIPQFNAQSDLTVFFYQGLKDQLKAAYEKDILTYIV